MTHADMEKLLAGTLAVGMVTTLVRAPGAAAVIRGVKNKLAWALSPSAVSQTVYRPETHEWRVPGPGTADEFAALLRGVLVADAERVER